MEQQNVVPLVTSMPELVQNPQLSTEMTPITTTIASPRILKQLPETPIRTIQSIQVPPETIEIKNITDSDIKSLTPSVKDDKKTMIGVVIVILCAFLICLCSSIMSSLMGMAMKK